MALIRSCPGWPVWQAQSPMSPASWTSCQATCPAGEAAHHETFKYCQSTSQAHVEVLQYLLHMPQVEFALGAAESTAKVQNLGQNWGMCSQHCNTSHVHVEESEDVMLLHDI